MKKTFEVGPGERLEGLRVIAFHGKVDPAQTPGQRGPVLADEQGRLVGLEQLESSAGKQRLQLQVGEKVGPGPLSGSATRLEHSWRARWGHVIVVLGTSEQAHASALLETETQTKDPEVEEFLRWLGSGETTAARLTAQRVGELALWYCAPPQVFALYQRIARVAEKEVFRTAVLGDTNALYRASWWLTRAALDDTDRFLATVGLERSDPGMATAYRESTFRKKSPQDIEDALTHARGVFSERCKLEQQPVLVHVASPDIGSLGAPRNSALSRFRLHQDRKQAA